MQVFQFRDGVVGDYASYIKSFINVANDRIRQTVDESLAQGLLWRDPLVQLNPTFQAGGSVDDLVKAGKLHAECQKIFRRGKKESGGAGLPLKTGLCKPGQDQAHLAKAA